MYPLRGARPQAILPRRTRTAPRAQTARSTEPAHWAGLPERRPASRPFSGLAFALILGLLATTGCTQAPTPQLLPEASTSTPESPPDQAVSPEETPDEAGDGQAEQPDQAEDGVEAEKESDPSVIVIETGTARGSKRTLWEAAVAAREARKTARPPVASVTNENLHEYQDAELTFAEPSTAPEGDQEDDEAAGEAADGEESEAEAEEPAPERQDEQYWRSLVLDIRLRMRAAFDEIEKLDAEVASLRTSFYAEDDPYIRDGQIKPAWDRAIGRLASTRRRVTSLRQELEEALEDGRRAGALAGWLREGIELEPSFEEERSVTGETDGGGLSIHESQELDTVEPAEPSNTTPEDPPP